MCLSEAPGSYIYLQICSLRYQLHYGEAMGQHNGVKDEGSYYGKGKKPYLGSDRITTIQFCISLVLFGKSSRNRC